MANQYDAIYGVGWYDYAKYNYQNISVSIDSLYVISSPISNSLVSNYHVKKTSAQTLNQNAEIVEGYILFSNYQIKKLGISDTITSDAYIHKEAAATLVSDYWIKGIVSATIISNASIDVFGQVYLVSNYLIGAAGVWNIYSNSYIRQTYLKSIYADYNLKAAVSATIASDYYLRSTKLTTITGRAHILKETTLDLISNYSVFRTYTVSQVSDANIVRIMTPVLIDPPDGTILPGWPPIFTWYIPNTAVVGGADVHCGISFAYDFAFTNQIDLYTTFRTDANVTFEYLSGSSWLPYPITGLPLASQGTNARATITNLPGGTKYWRVRLCRK